MPQYEGVVNVTITLAVSVEVRAKDLDSAHDMIASMLLEGTIPEPSYTIPKDTTQFTWWDDQGVDMVIEEIIER